MNYGYSYLIWTSTFGIVWLSLFLSRKDLRKEMLLISVLFGIGGVTSQLTNIVDYWKPITVTGTKVGFEDFFIGFFIAGIAAVVYTKIFNKRIKIKLLDVTRLKTSEVFIVFPLLYFGSFYIFNLGSAYSTLIAFIPTTTFLLLRRRDLLANSFISGLFMMCIGISTYLIMEFLQPGFIKEFWYLRGYWYDSMLLGIPIAEYLWFLLAGMFIGPLFEYWQEGKLEEHK
jgi:hypothetical protein